MQYVTFPIPKGWTADEFAASQIVERNLRAGYPMYSGVVLNDRGYPMAPAPVACPLLPPEVPVEVWSFRELEAEAKRQWLRFEQAQGEVVRWEEAEVERLLGLFPKRGTLLIEPAVLKAIDDVTERWMFRPGNIDRLFDDEPGWRRLARHQVRLRAIQEMGRLMEERQDPTAWRQGEYLSDEYVQREADERRSSEDLYLADFWPEVAEQLKDPLVRLVFDGATTRQAAEVAGVSQSTVNRRARRAYEESRDAVHRLSSEVL